MKKYVALLCLLVLTSFVSVNGQDLQGKFSLSPFSGLTLPMGELANNKLADIAGGDAIFRKIGFKFGIAIDYFFTSNLAAGLDFRYVSFGSKKIDADGQEFESDSKITGMLFGVHGKYFFIPEGSVRPYAIAGGGLYTSKLVDVEDALFPYHGEGTFDFDIDSKPYLLFGGGVVYFVSPSVSIFGEATLDYTLTDGAMYELEGVEMREIKTNYYFIDFVVGLNIWFGATE